MTDCEMLKITVPGSTANLGPGFDSVGLAVNKFLTLEVVPAVEWFFEPMNEEMKAIPSGTDNLTYKVAEQVARSYGQTLPPQYVKVYSDIPLARGVGSSASAIVAGIELANELLSLSLSKKEKLKIASSIEGHPDNVGASSYGGLIISVYKDDEVEIISKQDIEVDLVMVIPRYEVLTSDSRSVLPKSFDFSEAVEASAVSNVLAAALMTNNWEVAGKMMKKDKFHQPYRSTLCPDFHTVEELGEKHGAYGVALSGAGPSILAFTPKGTGEQIKGILQSNLSECDVEVLQVVPNGSIVEKIEKVR